MTIQEALAFGRQQLTHSPSPVLDARLLLEHVLDQPHPYLVAHREEPLTAVQEQRYSHLIERAAAQEPVPYLTGAAYFLGRKFHVTPSVLIPRPETEQLVERALAWAGSRPPLTAVDIGTGSGCIAVSLALALPHATIEAVDISESALEVARRNAQAHAVAHRVCFHQGDLLEPVNGRPDLILANLPYITDAEWTHLSNGVKSFEPASALRGGPLGLDFIHRLLQQAKELLSPNGAVFLEIGWKQGLAVKELALFFFPAAQVELSADFAGHDRVVSIIY